MRPEPASAERLSLTLPAEPESLPGLRRRLGRFLHAAGASDAEQYEITLSVCEAAGNAIEHAYGPGDAEFRVELRVDGQELTADVRDDGSWREPRGAERGRGLKIIDGLMDEVEVLPEEGGTVVRMRRTLGGEGAPRDDLGGDRRRAARRPHRGAPERRGGHDQLAVRRARSSPARCPTTRSPWSST